MAEEIATAPEERQNATGTAARSGARPMLTLDGVDLSFGRNRVVRGVSFDIAEGEFVCLLGPSGCGKTTLLRLIAGLEAPDAGRIAIAGEVVSTPSHVVPPHRRRVGLLFQDFALFPHLTVAQNIAFGLSGLDRAKADARTAELLDQIRLSDHADKYPHLLSGGEQQRVALARARAPRPRLMLLDEPFSDLDTSLRGHIRNETQQILKNAGVTTVMVTHDPEEAMLMADRIILMRDGKIVQAGTPDALYLRPVDAFTAEFFGDINRLDGVVEGPWIRTCLGTVANPRYPDGARVDVLVRTDAITLSPSADGRPPAGTEARVCAVQYAGRSSVVRIGLGEGNDPRPHFQVRLPGVCESRIGDRLRVQLDRNRTFVFEKTGGGTD